MAKIGFLGQKNKFWAKSRDFWPKENIHFLVLTMFSHDQAKLCNQNSDYLQNDISLIANLGCFFLEKWTFGQNDAFRQNVITAVSPEFRPGPGPLSMKVIFFMARTVFIDDGKKLRVLTLAK